MIWKFFNNTFEFTKELPIESSAWSGHYFFAYDLVSNIKPNVIVELGTHKGNSLFSFAQAIKDNNLKTELHGVDTWEGDKHAGYYSEDIYKIFLDIAKKYYNTVKIIPHKMYFDEAVKKFKDNSIDILHIDGLHTYEAVKHDFETWLPKVNREKGVILFHDVCEKTGDFGVYLLWDKLKKKYKNTITFEHYHGLGVLLLNTDFQIDKDSFSDLIQRYYAKTSKIQDLEKQIGDIESHAEFLTKENLSSLRKIKLLTNDLKNVQESLETKENELRKIYGSKSWKITQPIREFVKTIKGIKVTVLKKRKEWEKD